MFVFGVGRYNSGGNKMNGGDAESDLDETAPDVIPMDAEGDRRETTSDIIHRDADMDTVDDVVEPCAPSRPESCNGFDDNCNGLIDEGLWCPVALPALDPPIEDLYCVRGTATDDVWAVGMWGIILHWDGFSWSLSPTETYSQLNGVWPASRDAAWAVGEEIIRWDGSSWSQSHAPTGNPFRAVWGFSETDVWAVGLEMLHPQATPWPSAITAHHAGTALPGTESCYHPSRVP
jgi:hypothetical protein